MRIFIFLATFFASLACAGNAWHPDIKSIEEVNSPRPATLAPQTVYAPYADQTENLAGLVSGIKPWLSIAANSEQRQPVYLGRKPRELELGGTPAGAGLPATLRTLSEKQIKRLRSAMIKKGLISKDAVIALETWPARDDYGALTWTFARWKPIKGATMIWLDVKLPESDGTAPFLPEELDPSSKKDYDAIFGNVLDYKDLYLKPVFGDTVFVDAAGRITGAWINPDRRGDYAAGFQNASKTAAFVLPQPARLDGRPVSYFITSGPSSVTWPASLSWGSGATTPAAEISPAEIDSWPADFIKKYRNDVMLLSGETEAVFPLSKRTLKFTRKNNLEPDNHLNDIAAYLEERYSILGIKTRRQEFFWRGSKQTNLIAVIPGMDHSRPVIMADHIDTAFCEDVFENSGKRVSARGADDNMSAAAETLKGRKFARDIWLAHLTGEEFPADDLGARYFVSDMLKNKKDISGLILMDMIGVRRDGDAVFQVNAGESAESLALARAAIRASRYFPEFTAVLRTRFDPRSYLYNTDGLIFSDNGYPVVLLNEHINALENIGRKGYHDATDTSDRIDWNYAAAITKTAIQTAAGTAGME